MGGEAPPEEGGELGQKFSPRIAGAERETTQIAPAERKGHEIG